jgi:hypothetical protein
LLASEKMQPQVINIDFSPVPRKSQGLGLQAEPGESSGRVEGLQIGLQEPAK